MHAVAGDVVDQAVAHGVAPHRQVAQALVPVGVQVDAAGVGGLQADIVDLAALDGVVAALVDHRAEVAGVMDVAVRGAVADPVQLDAGLVADVDAAVALDFAVVDQVVAALQGEAVAAAQVYAAAAQIEQVAAAHPMVAAAGDQHAPGAGAADGAAGDRDVAAAADHDRAPAGGLDGEVA